MTRTTTGTALLCTATAALGWGCGAGNRALSAAEARAEGETPSVEVALDRLEDLHTRSEERRVGKECRRLCRSRWSPYH
jgi:hypothetical protein